jgi:hypothetical protein
MAGTPDVGASNDDKNNLRVEQAGCGRRLHDMVNHKNAFQYHSFALNAITVTAFNIVNTGTMLSDHLISMRPAIHERFRSRPPSLPVLVHPAGRNPVLHQDQRLKAQRRSASDERIQHQGAAFGFTVGNNRPRKRRH